MQIHKSKMQKQIIFFPTLLFLQSDGVTSIMNLIYSGWLDVSQMESKIWV